jgi:hypothetical protein
MRIVVVWPEGTHPELRDELESLPPRVRAERLRTLATLGLFIARGHFVKSSIQSERGTSETIEKAGAQNSKAFTDMMGRLKNSLT